MSGHFLGEHTLRSPIADQRTPILGGEMQLKLNTSPQPFDAVIAVTYRCNARCQMCNIWQVKDHDDCKPEDYRVIPTSLRHINVSGGEPFLRADLPEIIWPVRFRTQSKGERLVSSDRVPA